MHPNHANPSSKLSLPDCQRFAKETFLVQRESHKFCPEVFLLALIKSVTLGETSLRKITRLLSFALPQMTRQSLWARFTTRSTAFLSAVLHDLMEQRLEPVRGVLLSAEIKRVIVEDSTALVMGKGNAENFPAHGNAYGQTAGLKVDLAYDLLSGQCVSHTLEKATEQDRAIGNESLHAILPGDLVLRDMGYFKIPCFIDIEQMGAHWLSRLPLNCNAQSLEGQSLDSLLKKSKKAVVEMEVLLGDSHQHRCRLVAVRADGKIVQEKRRKRRLAAKTKGRLPSPKGLIRDGWHIMVTSLNPDEATAQELATLYTARWAIELQFRGIKSSMNLQHALKPITGTHQHYALVLAAMIAHQLTLQVWNIYYGVLEKEGRILSLEKLISDLLLYLTSVIRASDLLLYNPDPRSIAYDKRKRNSALVNKAFRPLA